MATKTQRLEVTLATELESADLAESVVAGVAKTAGFDDEEVHKLGIAVREGVVNAYNYGNRQDPRKKIHLGIEFEPERMIVHVADEGGALNWVKCPTRWPRKI
jgi:anti-sigma regulatory factor (Ser/Thr protein kinase)